MNDAILCMTATICPNVPMVSREEPADRLADYKKSIRFYLDQTELPIVFLENSNYNLYDDADFKAFEATGRFRLLRFQSHPDTRKGKGFQEFFMLDKFVREKLNNETIIKVSGRYIVKNISQLIPHLDAPLNIDLHRKMRVALTGFFSVQKSIYLEHFCGKYFYADDPKGHYIEHTLYDEILYSRLKSKSRLLPQNPQFEGISGSYGGSLSRNKYKMIARGMERKLIRRLGIRQFLIEY